MERDNSHVVSEIESCMISNENLGKPSTWLHVEVQGLGVRRLDEQPMINYDVSQQDISFHIHLH